MMLFNAKINWVMPEEGGRKNLPSPQIPYITVGKIRGSQEGQDSLYWSVRLEFNGADVHSAIVSFLVEEAPETALYAGTIIELFEGAKKVAEVQILHEKDGCK